MAARGPPDDKNHERLYVKVQREERQIIPPVQLARQEIKMTYLPSDQPLPCIITTSSSCEGRQQETEGIVGMEVSPMGAQSRAAVPNMAGPHGSQITTTSVMEMSSTLTTSSSKKAKVEVKSSSVLFQEEDLLPHAQVLEFFEEHGKNIQEQQLHQQSRNLVPQQHKRSASPSPVRQSMGLDHLDNLVKLMEQLSTLRDENLKLKKKCDYLESTKHLLQIKSAVESEIGYLTQGSNSLPKAKSKPKSVGRSKTRQRLPSAEDAQILESMEVHSESSIKRPKAVPLSKRSFSTGSIDIPSDIMEQSGEDEISEKILSLSTNKGRRSSRSSSKAAKSPTAKRKSKTSNWSKIIKVITRQKDPEPYGISVKGSRKSQPGRPHSKELTVPSSAIDGRSVDSGVGSGMEADGTEAQRRSTSSGEPMSPPPFTKEEPRQRQELDLTSDIWMGPPEWIKKHEDEFSTLTSDQSEKEVIILKSNDSKDDSDYLQVPITRRKSSPSLLDHSDREEDSSDEEEEDYTLLRRSSSYKIQSTHDNSDIKDVVDSPKIIKKTHKTPLGKVGKIFHVRKDSVKKQLSKKQKHLGEEGLEMDLEGEDEGPIGRSTPRTSPSVPRQRALEMAESPPSKSFTSHGTFDVSALMGGMSDEFSKKMKEWNELQTTKRFSASQRDVEGSESIIPEQIAAVSPEFQKKMDEWERTRSIKYTSDDHDKSASRESREGSPEAFTPPDTLGQSINIEEIQKKLTDSFSRKMEEWEKQKYKPREGSPGLVRKDSGGKSIVRKEERQKSRKMKDGKGKLERQRERELQRVEKEQQKLEKEKMRLEKERLKALEREARIEKMKGRLSQSDMDTKFKNPVLSPLAEYKVTSDFAKKLHQWELRKGSGSVSMATYLETQQKSLGQSPSPDSSTKKETFTVEEEPQAPTRKLSRGQKPPPLTLMPCSDSPDEVSPGARSRSSLDSFEDETSITTESMTESNISSLEKANARLLEELQEKELEYANLQEEVRDLNDKLNKARIQHSKELEQYKECLAGGSAVPPVSPLNMSNQLTELESKIQELKSFGENLAVTLESAAVCKWQSIEGEENVNSRLMDLLEKMRQMLIQASQSEEVYQKSSALHSFEKLYSQAMQLQLSNLRLSQIERNKEIMSMKRQLLLQEANNLLLQADITRRETELLRYKQVAKKNPSLKRWNTYGGMEGRVVEGKEAESVPPYKRFTKNIANKSAVSATEEFHDASEPSTSDTSKDDSLRTDDASPMVTRHSDTKSSSSIHVSPVVHTIPMTSLSSEEATYIPSKEQVEEIPEKYESTVVVPASQNQRQVIHTDKGVEISLTIKLPKANVSLPRDISQHELSVPRSQREKHVEPSTVAMCQVSELSESCSSSDITEMKFPELLIPEWKKTTDKSLQQVESHEVEEAILSTSVPSVASQPLNDSIQVTSDSSQSDSGRFTSVSGEASKLKAEEQSVPVITEEQAKSLEQLNQNKRHTFTGVMDTGSDTAIAAKPYKQTSVTISPLIGRRTYESSVHWPKMRNIANIHRIKPAEELLQESRRYRQGQSIYMTRILQKYALSEETKKYFDERQMSFDKENFAHHGYVKTIVQRLSREGTPESGGSSSNISVKPGTSITIHRADSPRAKSEFVQQIVRKLSAPTGPGQSRTGVAPLKDLTNGVGVKKLAQAFDSGRNTPERTLSDTEQKPYKSVLVTSLRKRSHDLGHISFDSSSSTSTLTSPNTTEEFDPYDGRKADSAISEHVINYSSMPLLSVAEEDSSDANNGYRERAATTTTCESSSEAGVRSSQIEEIHAFSDSNITCPSTSKRHISPKTIVPAGASKMEIVFPQRLTEKGSGKVKMGTIGLLCQQTMLSFDLGLTMKAEQQQKETAEVKLRKKSDVEEDRPRPHSTGSDTSSEDKKKAKSKFFESNWLQRPRRFFKVSKCCNRTASDNNYVFDR
ncbi:microtubule-associated protein futsch isoform X2 [Magallana gigas]|uniref:microtubule-associated protein futsch isoform X2 n=1 Tax=Magallana gigas TaxID=29159 RepID=UPI003342C99A